MSDKVQLSPPRGFRWNVVLDNNRRELWQVLVSFTVWWWVHVSKDLVLVSLSSAAGGTTKVVLTITCDSLGP